MRQRWRIYAHALGPILANLLEMNDWRILDFLVTPIRETCFSYLTSWIFSNAWGLSAFVVSWCSNRGLPPSLADYITDDLIITSLEHWIFDCRIKILLSLNEGVVTYITVHWVSMSTIEHLIRGISSCSLIDTDGSWLLLTKGTSVTSRR